MKNFNYLKTNKFNFERKNEYKTEVSIINVSKVIINDEYGNYLPFIEFICKMLAGGLKSPLLQEVREKRGLVYSIGCYLHEPVNEAGIVVISTETSKKNQVEVQKIIKDVIDNPEKYLTEERFEIVRQYYEIKFRKEKESQHSSVSTFIYKTQSDLETLIFTDSISYSDILDVYKKYFIWNDFYKSIDTKEFTKNEKENI